VSILRDRDLSSILILGLILSTLASGVGLADELYPRKNAIVRVVEKVGPAVVNINTEEIIEEEFNPFRGLSSPFFEEFFRDFFEAFPKRNYKRQSLGSGVIIDPQGYILTNEHVISRATSIRVTLIDNREFEARLIGADARSDLAVIKIDSRQPLPYVKMGRSDDLMPGETVVAIGNPFGLSHTVTTGIISALHRSIKVDKKRIYSDFIQVDASINPGNSGGPLLNINGELIGINTAIYQGAQGIGFAIPIDRAKRIVDDLINYGKVEEIWLGIMVQDLNPELSAQFQYPYNFGVLISRVSRGSPGQEADLRPGDIIEEIDGQKVLSSQLYFDLISSYTVNDRISVKYFRDGQTRTTTLIAKTMPLALVDQIAREVIGVSVKDISLRTKIQYHLYTSRGVVITQVEAGSPAERIGIRPGDVIRQINSLEINDLKDFKKAISSLGNDRSVLLLIQRGSQGYYVTLPL